MIASSAKPAVSRRTVLMTTEGVGDLLGLDNEAVLARAESQYRWVWNITVSGRAGQVRRLRFLAAEIADPDQVKNLELPQVLQTILGGKQNFHPGEVGRMLRISRRTRLDLDRAGALPRSPGCRCYSRTALEGFLTERLLNP